MSAMKNRLGARTAGRPPLRKLSAALAGFVAISSLAVSTANAGSIDFWTLFSGPDGAAIDALVKDFNASAGKAADVQVNLLIIPWDDFNTKLSVAMAARKPPALTVVNSDQVPVYAKQGALTPFTPDELAAAGIDKSDYVPAAWSAGEVKGKQFGVPISIFPRSIYYNKALFEKAGLDPNKPPATAEDMMKDAKAVAALGDGTYGLWFNLSGAGTFRNFYSVYWQYADSLYSDDNSRVSDDFTKIATKVLTEFKSFVDSGVMPTKDIGDVGKLFAQNKIGIAISQITDLPIYQTAAANLGLEYGVGAFPQFGDKPAAFAMAHEFLIPRGTSDAARADAMTFIKWIGARGVDWAKTGKVPTQYSVINSDAFKALADQASVTASSLDIAHFPPPLAVQPAIDRVVQQVLEEFFSGRTTVDEAVAKLSSAINAQLAKQ